MEVEGGENLWSGRARADAAAAADDDDDDDDEEQEEEDEYGSLNFDDVLMPGSGASAKGAPPGPQVRSGE